MLTHKRLSRLETLELYSFTNDFRDGDPSFELGNPLAHEQGARGVCKEIGRLVSLGALPALKQVKPTGKKNAVIFCNRSQSS